MPHRLKATRQRNQRLKNRQDATRQTIKTRRARHRQHPPSISRHTGFGDLGVLGHKLAVDDVLPSRHRPSEAARHASHHQRHVEIDLLHLVTSPHEVLAAGPADPARRVQEDQRRDHDAAADVHLAGGDGAGQAVGNAAKLRY